MAYIILLNNNNSGNKDVKRFYKRCVFLKAETYISSLGKVTALPIRNITVTDIVLGCFSHHLKYSVEEISVNYFLDFFQRSEQ